MPDMKDLFIDNNIAKELSPPLSQEYKELIDWLFKEGALVVSQKLLNEFNQGLVNLSSVKRNESILGIIGKLTQEGRINKISSHQLNNYTIPKKNEKTLLSNWKDRDHLKTIILSFRKLAITSDNNFRRDINGFSKVDKIQPRAAMSPSGINYK